MFKVELLAKEIYNVWFEYIKNDNGNPYATVCVLEDTSTGKQYEALAVCHHNDSFRRTTGRKTALKYALNHPDLFFNKDIKTLFWQEYLKTHKV